MYTPMLFRQQHTLRIQLVQEEARFQKSPDANQHSQNLLFPDATQGSCASQTCVRSMLTLGSTTDTTTSVRGELASSSHEERGCTASWGDDELQPIGLCSAGFLSIERVR